MLFLLGVSAEVFAVCQVRYITIREDGQPPETVAVWVCD